MSFSKFVNEIKVYRDNIEDKLYDISQLLANLDKIIEKMNAYLKDNYPWDNQNYDGS